jgi:hypothetical protein
MSHRRKGQITATPEYRKHLRPFGRREFWSGERMAEKELIRDLLEEALEPVEIEEWEDWSFEDDTYEEVFSDFDWLEEFPDW